jgi:hypothetical protein
VATARITQWVAMSGVFGHCPASPSESPPSCNLRSRGNSVASNRACHSVSPSRPSPAVSPRRCLPGSITPTSPSRRRSKRSVSPPSRANLPRIADAALPAPLLPFAAVASHNSLTVAASLVQQVDDADIDDRSEIAWSEASTSAVFSPSFQQGPGSKRARQLMEAVQRSRPDRLTAAKLEAKVAEDCPSPAHNLRSLAHRSHPPAMPSPPREPVQMKMVSFAVQTRAPGARRPSTTPESYIKQVIDNGDGADLLRVSCALGFLLSAENAQSDPQEAMSYIDDSVLAATKALRSIASSLVLSIEELLVCGQDKGGALLNCILLSGLKELRSSRRFQRTGSLTSFLYHEVAAHEAPAMDSLALASFCLCMWAFIREHLGDQRKPVLHVSAARDNATDFCISLRYPRGAWRHYQPTERGVREMTGEASGPGGLPYTPLHLIGVLLHRFWASSLSVAVRRSASTRATGSNLCSKWLSLILELDRDKGLGLAQSVSLVSGIRAGLEQGRLAAGCLPEIVALIARYAEERDDEVPSALRSGGAAHAAAESAGKELWAAYSALAALVRKFGGGGEGVGGEMATCAVLKAADLVGQSASTVMSRATSVLRRSSAAT